jgi:hypothetical protein
MVVMNGDVVGGGVGEHEHERDKVQRQLSDEEDGTAAFGSGDASARQNPLRQSIAEALQ